MKEMKYPVIVMLVVSISLFLPETARAKMTYKIIMLVGNVKIISGGKTRVAAVNQALTGGETVVTGTSSMADISMGGSGYMRIQEKTRVSLAVLSKKGASDLDMNSGGVLVFLSKMKKSDRYEVKSRTTVASVRGTIFQVSGDEQQSELNVFAGSVMASPVKNGVIQSQIAQMVSEGQSLNMTEQLVADILAKKKKLTLSAVRSEVKESFMKQALQIRESPEFKQYGGDDIKKQINDKIEKIKQDLKDKKLDTNALKEQLKSKKDELLKNREQMIKELKDKVK